MLFTLAYLGLVKHYCIAPLYYFIMEIRYKVNKTAESAHAGVCHRVEPPPAGIICL